MPKAPITNITFGTMTLGYRGYGARVHDAATAEAMLGAVLEFGHDQLDTCSVYSEGTCEQMLGDLRAAERFGIAARIHSESPPGSAARKTSGWVPECLPDWRRSRSLPHSRVFEMDDPVRGRAFYEFRGEGAP